VKGHARKSCSRPRLNTCTRPRHPFPQFQTDCFAALPDKTRLAIIKTGLVKRRDEKLVAKVVEGPAGQAGREDEIVMLQVERSKGNDLPVYKDMRLAKAAEAARAKAAGEA